MKIRNSLKSLRNRFESCIRTLPKQVVPLMLFNAAAIRGEFDAMRRFAFQARHCGVNRVQLLPFLQIALVYAGDLGGEAITDAVAPVFEHWAD